MKPIIRQVKDLLSADKAFKAPHQAYGYEDTRHIIQHPDNPTQYVVKVDGKKAANPIPYEEILMAMGEIRQSGIDLTNQNSGLSPEEKQKKLRMLDKAYSQIKAKIDSRKEPSDHQPADLFGSKKSKQNKAYQKSLKSLSKHLKHYIDLTAQITHSSAKKLDAQGHIRRSKERPPIVQEMSVGRDEDENSTHFIMYIPAGRYTERQLALREIQGKKDASSTHSTSSHHKKGLVHGNSNFARMIVGKKDEQGEVTILHDSFTGPGARLPYKSLKGADKYKAMAIKSITFLNQEEIIQAVAQRVYEQKLAGHTNEELKTLLKNPPDQQLLSDNEYKKALINQYFKENPLIETYTQVISPGQGNIPLADGSDANIAQFEYVRDAIRAFDGADNLPLLIETDTGEPLEINGQYQGRHGAFGVNWFKSTSDSVASSANRRFINQIIDDTLADLPTKDDLVSLNETSGQAAEALGAIQDDYSNLKEALDSLKETPEEIAALNDKSAGLSQKKADYRNQLMAYSSYYQTWVNFKNQKRSKEDIKAAEGEMKSTFDKLKILEADIHKQEKEIDKIHTTIEKRRGSVFKETKLSEKMGRLRESISTYKTGDFEKHEHVDEKRLTDTFNKAAYMVDAQDLYYNKTWADDKQNFKLQTLLGSLATALGHANTKGCKSNNDRGQRLAQKIAGNLLFTEQSATGLYDGQYFAPSASPISTKTSTTDEASPLLETEEALQHTKEDTLRNEVNTELLTIQTLHHTANTGVGGGKFAIRNKHGFADNGLLGKVANLAKLPNVGQAKLFDKKNKLEITAGILTGGLYYLGKFIGQRINQAISKNKIKSEASSIEEAVSQEIAKDIDHTPPDFHHSGATMIHAFHEEEQALAHREQIHEELHEDALRELGIEDIDPDDNEETLIDSEPESEFSSHDKKDEDKIASSSKRDLPHP